MKVLTQEVLVSLAQISKVALQWEMRNPMIDFPLQATLKATKHLIHFQVKGLNRQRAVH